MAERKKAAKKTAKKAVKKTTRKTTKKATKKATKKVTKKAAVAPKAPPVAEDRQFAVEAARIARDRHCTQITVLDLTGLSPATNYYVIATSTSDRQARTVADEITAWGKKHNMPRFGLAGYEQGQWILLDFVDVVVHLFDAEHRGYYNLEMLWGDAKEVPFEEPSGIGRKSKSKSE